MEKLVFEGKKNDDDETKSDLPVVVLRVLRVLCSCKFFCRKDFFAERSRDMG